MRRVSGVSLVLNATPPVTTICDTGQVRNKCRCDTSRISPRRALLASREEGAPEAGHTLIRPRGSSPRGSPQEGGTPGGHPQGVTPRRSPQEGPFQGGTPRRVTPGGHPRRGLSRGAPPGGSPQEGHPRRVTPGGS